VYKHDLFNRDRPEDLSLLRRRTCPTIDGRRQSLSRPMIKKQNLLNKDVTKVGPTEISKDSPHLINGKRRHVPSLLSKKFVDPAVKRTSLVFSCPVTTGEVPVKNMDSLSNAVSLTESDDSDDQVAAVSRNGNINEVEDQSMVVIKIASQLAQHARNSWNGSRISGLVTPPFGASRNGSISSGTLLTYDDERERVSDLYEVHPRESQFNSGISFPDDRVLRVQHQKKFGVKQATLSQSSAEGVVNRLVVTLDIQNRGAMGTAVKVACFCMVTYPSSSERNLCGAIRDILSSCSRLTSEFQLYRSALRPVSTTEWNNTKTHQQFWEHEESRCDTIRSFSVFAVNYMQNLYCAVNACGVSKYCNDDDMTTLEQTISLWQKYGAL
jgi:hypothetical protein